MATVLDGRAAAAALIDRLRPEVAALVVRRGRPPGLAVLLVGEDPASATYVRHKERQATALGLHSRVVRLPATAAQATVLAAVAELNADPAIDAFLVQLPLPPQVDAAAVGQAIAPAKDADGLHPDNLGRLVAGLPGPRPCTPAGVMHLLALAPCRLRGAHAVVLGRSDIVGKPQALLLLAADATVTVCHSRSADLAAHVRRADVLVAAVGRPHLVPGDWIKPGATVVDVGINRVDGRLVGDVEYEGAAARAAAITPVPGGVGPMTIAMLLRNAVAAAGAAAPNPP